MFGISRNSQLLTSSWDRWNPKYWTISTICHALGFLWLSNYWLWIMKLFQIYSVLFRFFGFHQSQILTSTWDWNRRNPKYWTNLAICCVLFFHTLSTQRLQILKLFGVVFPKYYKMTSTDLGNQCIKTCCWIPLTKVLKSLLLNSALLEIRIQAVAFICSYASSILNKTRNPLTVCGIHPLTFAESSIILRNPLTVAKSKTTRFIRLFRNPLTFWYMFKDWFLEFGNIQTQNCACIQCTVWPRYVSNFTIRQIKHLVSMFTFKYGYLLCIFSTIWLHIRITDMFVELTNIFFIISSNAFIFFRNTCKTRIPPVVQISTNSV